MLWQKGRVFSTALSVIIVISQKIAINGRFSENEKRAEGQRYVAVRGNRLQQVKFKGARKCLNTQYRDFLR